MNSPDILRKILARKRVETEQRKSVYSISELETAAKNGEKPRPFVTAINSAIGVGQAAVIAETKKASPSKGVIRRDFDPVAIAKSYVQYGATCLSVLTDIDFFQGQNDFLTQARRISGLPTLRKDFLIDAWQIVESRVIGADCVLLIVAALEDSQIAELMSVAAAYQMDVLLEVHDFQELERALAVNPNLIGINNRNLHTFETRLETTLELVEKISPDQLVVTESGIHTKKDVVRMRKEGVNAFLVGEAFLRVVDPGKQMAKLFGQMTSR